jgi:nitrate/TMAO reductase-like tetraheme cytochrome c subunit
VFQIHTTEDVLRLAALASATIAILILVYYLVVRPPLGRSTKVVLLFGLGVMPLGVSLAGNISGFEYTLRRDFCGSCHVMRPYIEDAADPTSTSLASIHSRNSTFGQESCYTCHADYQIFGAMTTKANGLKHLYYYLTEFSSTGPYGEGGKPIHMYKKFENAMCTRCHSTRAPRWGSVEDHAGMMEELRQGGATCIDCHTGDKIHPRAFAHGGNGKAPASASAR